MRDFIQLNKLRNGFNKKKQRKRFILHIVLLFEKNKKNCKQKNCFLIDLQIKTKMYAKL